MKRKTPALDFYFSTPPASVDHWYCCNILWTTYPQITQHIRQEHVKVITEKSAIKLKCGICDCPYEGIEKYDEVKKHILFLHTQHYLHCLQCAVKYPSEELFDAHSEECNRLVHELAKGNLWRKSE